MDRRTFLYTTLTGAAGIGIGAWISVNPKRTIENSETTRLVSLHPSITETIYHLEGQKNLIGRSDFCKSPKQVEALPNTGTGLKPNVEKLVGLKPSHIFIDGSSGAEIEKLESIATVISLAWLTLEDVIASTLALGRILNKEAQAANLTNRYKKAFKSTKTQSSPTILMVFESSNLGSDALWFMRANCIHGQGVAACGFQNAAPPTSGPPSMSIEELIALDPDVLMVLTSNPDEKYHETLIRSFDKLPVLTAVKNQRVRVLHEKNVMSTGPQILKFLDNLKQQKAELF